jgi:hypothetical protein
MESGRLSGQHPRSLDTTLIRVTQLARALTMRVYEAKIQYLLVQEGPKKSLIGPKRSWSTCRVLSTKLR